jgi:hypothetical protein
VTSEIGEIPSVRPFRDKRHEAALSDLLELGERETFENYCSERWGLKRSYAYEVMQAGRGGRHRVPKFRTFRLRATLAWRSSLPRCAISPRSCAMRAVRLRQPAADVALGPQTGDGQSPAAHLRLSDFHAMVAVVAGLEDDHLGRDLAAAPAEWRAEIRRDGRRAARALSRLGRKP